MATIVMEVIRELDWVMRFKHLAITAIPLLLVACSHNTELARENREKRSADQVAVGSAIKDTVNAVGSGVMFALESGAFAQGLQDASYQMDRSTRAIANYDNPTYFSGGQALGYADDDNENSESFTSGSNTTSTTSSGSSSGSASSSSGSAITLTEVDNSEAINAEMERRRKAEEQIRKDRENVRRLQTECESKGYIWARTAMWNQPKAESPLYYRCMPPRINFEPDTSSSERCNPCTVIKQ